MADIVPLSPYYGLRLLNALKHAVAGSDSVDTSFSIKKYRSALRIRWSNSGTRMGIGSSTTFVKWKLWIPWLFGRGFLCRCSFDVDLNTAFAVEAGFGPFWIFFFLPPRHDVLERDLISGTSVQKGWTNITHALMKGKTPS